ncbi:hypothetical protein DVH24_002875 [Malus domestica]|uniref:SLC26A/SulP transporter domain-containing protein n=1 Tax=Malus domestica TaxID=3750 RepID=A0A498K646_MALDO|nr:hypothetical protein DVH24_002875 [Malus domestica]
MSTDYAYPSTNVEDSLHRVEIPPHQPFIKTLKSSLKETFFPDDPLRPFKNQTTSRKFILGFQYFFPILEWAPRYTLEFLKSDLISGITIASLAIPQGISYAKLANLPPILGLYSSFVPPLIYAMMGSSRDLAVGTVAVTSLLTASMLGAEVNAAENPTLYLHLAFTATFSAGVFQASLGLLRLAITNDSIVLRSSSILLFVAYKLGFIVDFLSHATIVGFMAGAATVVCLQQLKGILGLDHFTRGTDLVSVMRSVFSQTHEWRWESGVLGCLFLFFLLTTKYFFLCLYMLDNMITQSKKKPKLFWISAMAPLTSVVLGSVLVYLLHAEKHGVQVIGKLKEGINPLSFGDFVFVSPYLTTAFKAGVIMGIIALAVRPFSRSAVNNNAGCKTAMSNVIMAIAVMFTLLFLTPLFHYTPLVVLSAIIIAAMLGLIDYEAAIHLWKVDKFDFVICMSAYIGVVFGSVEIGLVVAVRNNICDQEVKKLIDRRGRQLVLANPGGEVMKKMSKSELIEKIGRQWIYLTVAEAVAACNFMLHTTKPDPIKDQEPGAWNNDFHLVFRPNLVELDEVSTTNKLLTIHGHRSELCMLESGMDSNKPKYAETFMTISSHLRPSFGLDSSRIIIPSLPASVWYILCENWL